MYDGLIVSKDDQRRLESTEEEEMNKAQVPMITEEANNQTADSSNLPSKESELAGVH
jgi:hypothetical protein